MNVLQAINIATYRYTSVSRNYHTLVWLLKHKAKKEVQKTFIQRSELERQDCKTALAKTEEKALELNDEVTQKETRKRELELAVAQSDVYKEQEKLFNQKQHCMLESQRLTAGLENLGQNIRLEGTRVSDLCEKISAWDEREELERVKQTALKAEKAYAALQKGGIELFSRSLALFERAQTATAELSSAVRDAAHKVEDQLEQYKEEEAQKRVVLANLRKNIKDYPQGLLQLQKSLSTKLEKQVGCPVELPILADVLEIKEEAWRGAVEGYLNTQKFYLLVKPAYYQAAVKLYDRIKQEFGQNSFGIVDVGKLREQERTVPQENSLAQKGGNPKRPGS